MCEPATALAAASLALGAAGAASSYVGQQQQAKAQNAYVQKNAEAARQSAMNQYADLQYRREQDRTSTAEQNQEVALQAIKARATAQTAAGEAGVTGLSVDQLIGDYYDRELTAKDRNNQQHEFTSQQLNAEMTGVQAQGDSRINSVRGQAGPSFFDTGLRIAGAGLDAAAVYDKYSPDGLFGQKTRQPASTGARSSR